MGKPKKPSPSVLEKKVKELSNTLPAAWSVEDVCYYLYSIGLGDYAGVFEENEISGGELLDLTESEILSIGVTKLGHRKKLMTKIQTLHMPDFDITTGNSERDSEVCSEKSGSMTGSTRSSSVLSIKETATTIVVKLVWDDKIRLLTVEENIPFDSLKRKVKREFHRRMRLYYPDDTGEIIRLKRTAHWNAAKVCSRMGDGKLTIVCRPRSSNDELYNKELDGVITCDESGKILSINKQACKLWGFRSNQVVGKNVTVLMPPDMGKIHQSFMDRYIETGKAHILGRGRVVVAEHKNGYHFSVYLTLTEKQQGGQRVFTGTCSPLSEQEEEKKESIDQSAYEILNGVLDPCIVINQKGIVQFQNDTFTKTYGYSNLKGSNVNTIMAGTDKANHDSYLLNYLSTGHANIIGIGRNVRMIQADGQERFVHLSVSERKISETERIYTGLLRPMKEEVQRSVDDEIEVVERLPIPAILISEEGIILAANNHACKVFGYKQEDMVQKNCSMLMPSPECSRHDSFLQRYVKNESIRSRSSVVGQGREVIAKHRVGRLLPIYLSVTEMVVNGHFFFTGVIQKV